ncbi:hypothetical protein [Jidongwangia harbinensis]|uniref:hypothetical protein n=1 Tax=Jidongwangia harbinensis TaxID=2878561 RepID=UPI001CD976C9|nr:hypothetical protein [Jidongwangia harbinensis]MCA2211812.1 hypothetical protein [Jidongwangia harbinensis]
MSYDEVQQFIAADARPGKVRGQGRKGALTALQDAAVLKTVYAFGTRRAEPSKVDLVDLRRNRKVSRHFSPGRHPALWVSERVGQLSPRSISEAFVLARRAAGLDEGLHHSAGTRHPARAMRCRRR